MASRKDRVTEEPVRELEPAGCGSGEGLVVQNYCFDVTREGAADAVVCVYDSKEYSPGSRLCQAGKVMLCSAAGAWEVTNPVETC